MFLQNSSIPFGPPAYFGAEPSSQPFYYGDAQTLPKASTYAADNDQRKPFPAASSQSNAYNRQPTYYTRVTSSIDPRNGKTSVHAIVDYDDDFNDAEYSQENDFNDIQNSIKQYPLPTVTPIQGPIFLKNGSVPVVPLYSYPKVNNGSFVQIPVSTKIFTYLSIIYPVEPP